MADQRRGGFLIAKINQVSGRSFDKKLKAAGLGGLGAARGRILFALWERDGSAISELVKATALEKSTLTAMLDRLELDGWVRRAPSAEDRRSIRIFLTRRDEAFRSAFLRVSEEMTDLFYRDFSSEEIDRFEAFLDRILANLRDEQKNR